MISHLLRVTLVLLAFTGIARSQSLLEALDNPLLTDLASSAVDSETGEPLSGFQWSGQTNTTHDGTDAAFIYGLNPGITSQITATIQGPATLSFWWKVNSQTTIERFGFSAPGASFSQYGDIDWRQYTVDLDCGEQDVTWYMNVREFATPAFNAAYLDEVVVTPHMPVPALQSGLDNNSTDIYSQKWAEEPAVGSVNGSRVHSGVVEEGESSSLLFELDGPVEVSYTWGIESDPDGSSTSASLRVNNSRVREIYVGEDERTETLKYGPGTRCFKFSYYRDYTFESPYTGENKAYIDNLDITPIPASAPLADAIELSSSLVYGLNWTSQTTTTHDGVDAATVSGLDVGDFETMYVEMPDDAGLLTFWIKTSTEENAGFLDVFVDGGAIAEASGEQDWRKVSVNLGQGSDRVLSFRYFREADDGGEQGDNAVFVDQILFQPGQTNFKPDLSIKAPGSGWKGRNRYNRSGSGQVAKYRARSRRPSGRFKLKCQNDSPEGDTMKFRATKSSRNFLVRYIIRSEGQLFNISAEFRTGKFSTQTLNHLRSQSYQVWIDRFIGARKRSQNVKIRGISESDGRKMDAVKAVLKVKR